jgi:membrane fusion protein (multidrug efflux system)
MEKQHRRAAVIGLGLLFVVVALVAGGPVHRHDARLQSTVDAQIDGYIYPITSRVSGYVTRVTVDDNDYVQAGTVLVQLVPETAKSRSPTQRR